MSELVVAPNAGDLESDPVAYMAVVLHRAKGWLAEAQNIESVRETKAIAVGYESVIREKELAFDAQLSATEIVRRCERRIGELVRQGQRDGSVTTNGQRAPTREEEVKRPSDALGIPDNHATAISQHYAMAAAPADEFEQAIETAREEGNLSRANVVRKVRGETRERSNGTVPTNGAARPAAVSRIAEQSEAMAMAISALDLTKSCERMTEDERQSALASCKTGIRALNTMARALGR